MIRLIADFNLADYEGLAEGVIYILVALSFLYKKTIFRARTWAGLCVAIVLIWIVQILAYLGVPTLSFAVSNVMPSSIFPVLATMIFATPALYDMYVLGFGHEKTQ